MKKLLKYILVATFIALSLSGTAVYADEGEESKYQAPQIPLPTSLPGIDPDELMNANGELETSNILAERVLPAFALGTIGLVGALSILFLIVAGIRFATAYGKDESVESAKRQATWSAVAFILAILSYTIVSIIINLDFGDSQNIQGPPEAIPSETPEQ